MPLVKTLLPFSVITFATGKFLIFVHLVIVHQVGRKASDFPGIFAEQRRPLVVYDWNSGTKPLQLPLSFVPVLNHSFLLGWVENWVPATLRPRLREIVCCPYLNSRAEHRLIKALGILLARPCCCKETPKGAVVSEEGALLGTAIPLVLPWASQEATAALAGEMLLPGSCWCWWAAVLAIAAGQALLPCADFLNNEFLHSSYFGHLQSSHALFSFLWTHSAFIVWLLDLNSFVSVIFCAIVIEGRLYNLVSFDLFPFKS